MLDKCANPTCTIPFYRFTEGKIFQFEMDDDQLPHKVEHFWLCARCAREFTMRLQDGEVNLVPSRARGAA